MEALTIASRLNNLHRIVNKKSPKDLSFPSCRSKTRFHFMRGLSRPPRAVLSRMFFAERFTDRVDRHVASGALRPKFQFDFEFEFVGCARTGSNAASFNLTSSNFRPESGIWKCAGGQAHARGSVADFQRCDREGSA